MTQTILDWDVIAKKTTALFNNKLSYSKTANTQYCGEFNKTYNGDKVGGSMRIRKPMRMVTRSGATFDATDLTETATTLTISDQIGVDMSFTSIEATQNTDYFDKRYLGAAAQALVTQIERAGITALMDTAYHTAGTANTAVNAWTTYDSAVQKLISVGVMPEYGVLNLADATALKGSILSLFTPALNDDLVKSSVVGRLSNTDVMQSPFAVSHESGTHAGTPLMNGATLEGATEIVTDGWTAAVTLKKNDIITIAGVYTVNPVDQTSTGDLQTFRVTADATADGSGNMTIGVSPSIYASGAYATVSALPVDGSAITVKGTASSTYNNSFVYHPDGVILGYQSLVMPYGVTNGAVVTDPESDVRLRVIGEYDYKSDTYNVRFDVAYGWVIIPEYVCRLLGGTIG